MAASFVTFGETKRRVSPNAPALRAAQLSPIAPLGKPRSAFRCAKDPSFVTSGETKSVFHRTLLHSGPRSVGAGWVATIWLRSASRTQTHSSCI
jgi:hypothetical protein